MNISRIVELKIEERRVYRDGHVIGVILKQVSDGTYYLVRKDDFDEALKPQEEEVYSMEEDFVENFPQRIDMEGRSYYVERTLELLPGRVLWIRYRTLEEELDEMEQEDKESGK